MIQNLGSFKDKVWHEIHTRDSNQAENLTKYYRFPSISEISIHDIKQHLSWQHLSYIMSHLVDF